MNYLFLTLIFPVLLFYKVNDKTDNIEDLQVYSGKFVTVSIEKTLYETKSSNDFFIKVTVQNKTSQTIGVDLSNGVRIIHPNQYGIYTTPYRLVIDEITLTPETLNEAKINTLIEQFKSQKLTMIQPNKSVEFYRNFNGGFNPGDKEKIKTKEGEYLIVSCDGQLFVTDGKTVENIYFCKDNKNGINYDLSIPHPVKWKTIPANALIIDKK